MEKDLINPLFENDQNPPFVYLADKYSFEYTYLSLSSEIIHSAAIASAKEFVEITSIDISKDLIHFFFDLLLCLSSKSFSNSNKDIYSASIDGIHFKYFGQPSQNKINTAIQLMAEKEKCFLSSFFDLFKKDDFARMTAVFAFYAGTNELIGATTGITIAEALFGITDIISPKLISRLKLLKDKST